MKNKSFVSLVVLIVSVLLIGPGFSAMAASPVAKVTSFRGEAYIQTGTTVFRINQIGQVVLDGDRIQTRDGEVRLAFTDGASMTINPFSTTMIQEQEEESGFWVFKTKKLVRRMTAFVGKLHFKSGSSQRENYLQTPTAVCGLRGSEAEFGFDNATSLLNLISGLINLYGTIWKQGPFPAPGSPAANRNPIYQKLSSTQALIDKANQSGSGNDQAQATLSVYELVRMVGQALAANPNPAIQQYGQSLIGLANQGIANLLQQNPNLTTVPTTVKITVPTKIPTVPTTVKTTAPTTVPTTVPTTAPTTIPTTVPTTMPTSTTSIPPSMP